MYLIEYEKGLLLFDSGTRADVDLVKDYIVNTLSRPMEDLKLVLVSHAHPDHSGGAFYFQKMGVPIAGTDLLNEWYAGVTGFIVYLVDVALTYMVWMKKKKEGDKLKNLFFPRKLHFDFLLEDGKKLPVFSDWISLSCAGHTESDLSFYHQKDGILYVGDNLISQKNGFIVPYPIVNPKAYKESLRKYLELKPRKFLLAHYGEVPYQEEHLVRLIRTAPEKSRRHGNALIPIIYNFMKKFFFVH